jgi:hypothetical protein
VAGNRLISKIVDGLIQALGTTNPSGRARHRFRSSGKVLRVLSLFITTTLVAAMHQHLHAQGVTPEEPPSAAVPNQDVLPDTSAPDLSTIPHASLLPSDKAPEIATIDSDGPQTRHGDIGYASGNVVVTYGDHVLRADSITYDHATDNVTAEGNVELSGGKNDEHIRASRGIYNLRTQTGRFFDVQGSATMRSQPSKPLTLELPHPTAARTCPAIRTPIRSSLRGALSSRTGPPITRSTTAR